MAGSQKSVSSDFIKDPMRKLSTFVDGVFVPIAFTNIRDEIANWDVDEKDVWVCSAPKSGTTWTQEMVWLIMNGLDYTKAAEEHILKRFVYLEGECFTTYDDAFSIFPEFIMSTLSYIRQQKKPYFMKTHLPWQFLPMEIREHTKRPKIIYITRNPKDTCVSHYYFAVMTLAFGGSLEEFADLFLQGRINFCPFWDHVLSFWEQRNEPNILFLKFEDMKADLPAVLRRVGKFLGKELKETDIEKLADHLSFKNMKANPAVNPDIFYPAEVTKNLSFMRAGEVGNHKLHMSKEMEEKFDRWIEENTKNTGLTY